MLLAVQHFLETCKSNGLFIVDRPTGDGKTYDALRFIAQNFNKDDGPNFFYLTPLNKNVNDAYKDLADLFTKAGRKEEFDLYSIRIPSNVDCIINNLPGIEKEFTEPFKGLESFRILKSLVKNLSKMNKESYFYNEALKIIQENEPIFRREIINLLPTTAPGGYKKLKTLARINYIKEHFPYLLKLYPSIETRKKKIFFMSIDKFYFGNSTIVENGYRFMNNSIVKNSVIFIDEIDSTKRSILDKQIEDSLQHRADIFKLYRQINNSLLTTKIPSKILNELDDEETKYKSKETLAKIKEKFANDYKKYELNKLFKYESEDNDKSFLFNDFEIHTYSNNPKKKLIIEDDEEKSLNLISIREPIASSEKERRLEECIQAIRGLISYFINGIAIISRNYLKWYNSEGKKSYSEDIEDESAISTVLESFDIDKELKSLLIQMIANNYNSFQNKKRKSVINTDFYEEGFRYYSFFDQIDHNETTNVSMVDLFDTPESFLLQLASKANIVGLSATGTIESVTGNYDIRFLQRKLGNNYFIPSKEDKERMMLSFQEHQKENTSTVYVYNIPENTNWQSKDFGKTSEILLNSIFSNEENKAYMKQHMENIEHQPNNIIRFLKVVVTIKKFLNNKNSKAILVLTNRNAKSDDSDLFSETEIISFIQHIKAENTSVVPDNSIILLYGKDFEERKKRIGKDIKDGKKVIILSSYPSSGTGQNLQYEIEDENGVLKANDIDSLYLEKPTNMLVNTNNGLTEGNLIKYIYQIEALSQVGDISSREVGNAISFGFKKFAQIGESSFKIGNIYKTESINNNLVINLNQAIGRICRTKKKSNDVNIYVDNEILQVDFSCMRGKNVNKEFKAFVDSIGKIVSAKGFDQDEKTMNKNNRSCLIAEKKIGQLMTNPNSIWTKENIKQWKGIRKLVMERPTIRKEELDNYPYASSLYIQALPNTKINKCFYSSDLHSVSFIQDKEHPFELSFYASRVDELLKNPTVMEWYNQHNYLHSFEPNEFLINPVVFNNIFKGIVGEEVGKALLEKAGIRLKEIDDPEKFEKFDFVLESGPDIYFDCKFWNDLSCRCDSEEMMRKAQYLKIEEKIKSINAKKVFIVNILGNKCHKCSRIGDNHNIFLIPSLIDEETNKANLESLKYIQENLGD